MQRSKAVHIVSAQLASLGRHGFRDIFYLGQQAYLSGDYEGAIPWLFQALRYLPDSQAKFGPSIESDSPTFHYQDVYDYLSWSYYYGLNDKTMWLKYQRTFEQSGRKGDEERNRASQGLDFYLGSRSVRRNEEYEGVCESNITQYFDVAPALPIVSKYGFEQLQDMAVSRHHDAGTLGQSFHMRIDDGKTVRATPISRPPGAANITHLHGFLSKEECEHLINIATPNMAETVVVDPDTGKEVVEKYRTSKGTWLKHGTDYVADKINIRLAALTQKGMRTHEELHVVHYQSGQEYQPHYDFCDPARDKDDWTSEPGGNREITVIMYLKAPGPNGGGKTAFPMARHSVEPQQGDAVMFNNLNQNGYVDHLTMHGGCPPNSNEEKWIATKWIRQREPGPEKARLAGGIKLATGYYA